MGAQLYRSRRNFRRGKTPEYAAKGAFIGGYHDGHFGTVNVHMKRARRFLEFIRERHGIRDLARQDMRPYIHAFAVHVADRVACGKWSLTYGTNLISTVNVLFEKLRGDREWTVSPSAYLGRRTQIRTRVPGGLDDELLEAALRGLCRAGFARPAMVLELAGAFGVRFREACLADIRQWRRQAIEKGTVNVQAGTKGGRRARRLVPTEERHIAILNRAIAILPDGSRNLLDPDETFKGFRNGDANRARGVLKDNGIQSYREQRAAYACKRYAEITGCPAPVLTGGAPTASREEDLRAREILSQELGHNRVDVLGAYIGGRRRRKRHAPEDGD